MPVGLIPRHGVEDVDGHPRPGQSVDRRDGRGRFESRDRHRQERQPRGPPEGFESTQMKGRCRVRPSQPACGEDHRASTQPCEFGAEPLQPRKVFPEALLSHHREASVPQDQRDDWPPPSQPLHGHELQVEPGQNGDQQRNVEAAAMVRDNQVPPLRRDSPLNGEFEARRPSGYAKQRPAPDPHRAIQRPDPLFLVCAMPDEHPEPDPDVEGRGCEGADRKPCGDAKPNADSHARTFLRATSGTRSSSRSGRHVVTAYHERPVFADRSCVRSVSRSVPRR